MGCIVSGFVGCCSGCSKTCCSTCGSCGPTPGYSTRIPYLLFMFISIIIALCLKIWGKDLVLDLYVYDYATCPTETCAGNQAVYRFSFALFLFFLSLFLAMQSPSTASFHHQFWGFKILYFITLVIISFLLPNDFLSGYSYACRFFSGLFLLLQVVSLIDSFYIWNEKWVEKDQRKYYIGLVLISLLFYIISFTFLGLGYDWYAKGSDCGLQRFFLSFTFILIAAFSFISISSIAEHGALLPSALVAGYCAFLVLNGLNSDPSSCNSLYDPNETNVGVVLAGLLLAAVSITWSSWRVATTKNLFRTQEEPADADLELVEQKVHDDEPIEEESVLQDPETRRGNAIFHGIMVLASMYMAMLLTSWAAEVVDSSSNLVSVGAENMWVNVVTQWVCAFLYIWTLIAPRILVGREF